MSTVAQSAPPATFDWRRWPETEAFVDEAITTALEGNAFAAKLSDRMRRETGTEFKVWVDHLVLRGGTALQNRLEALGYRRDKATYSFGVPVFVHHGGMFPRIALTLAGTNGSGATGYTIPEVAIKVERVAGFLRAHDL